MGWSDERVKTLKKLWLDGLSASQVARQLGAVTRNAVIGKVHRLGLAGRAVPSAPSRPRHRAPRPPRPMSAPASPQRSYGHDRKTQARPTPLPVRPFVELPGTATILTLSRHMCKWPIGHPDAEDFTFCGRRASDEGPYCLDHARVAYQPPQGKKKSSGAELIRGLRRYA